MTFLLGSLQAADETKPESEMVTAGPHSKVSSGCNASGPFVSARPCFHPFFFGYPLMFAYVMEVRLHLSRQSLGQQHR